MGTSDGGAPATCHTCCDAEARYFGTTLSGTQPREEGGCAPRNGISAEQRKGCTEFAVKNGFSFDGTFCRKYCDLNMHEIRCEKMTETPLGRTLGGAPAGAAGSSGASGGLRKR